MNMTELTSTILDVFVNGLSEILGSHLERVVLYGSYARGDFNNSSDVDIMVLTNLDDDEIEIYKDKIYDLAYDIGMENDIALSTLVKNIGKYQKRVEIIPFYRNVQNEGVVLYG